MNKPAKSKWIGGAAVALLLCGLGAVALAQADVQKTRSDAMKSNGAAMKAIKAVIDSNGAAADATASAQKIAEVAAMIPELFPPGSNQGDSKAMAEIWQNWDDFKSKADSLKMQADMLVSATQAGDLATVRAQFEKVGGACGACHKAYRMAK